MARFSQELREALLAEIGAPFDFGRVRDVFGSSAAAADFLGLRRPARGTSNPEMVRRRKTFQQSWSRWSRQVRRPSGGWWDRLRSAAERAELVRQVRLFGLVIESWAGEVDVYGSDVRDREIDEEVFIEPAELEDAAGYNFYAAVGRNDWTEAGRAVATAWFSNYVGNDLSGGDVSLGEGDLVIRIPRSGGAAPNGRGSQ